MQKLNEIWEGYKAVDDHLWQNQAAARPQRASDLWARRRELNANAYFVTLFACFEDRVNGLCERLVRRKRSGRSWKQRRLWDTASLDRLTFLRKAALLLDKGGRHYQAVQKLYDIRCDIAHGSPVQVGAVKLPTQYEEIQALWRALSP